MEQMSIHIAHAQYVDGKLKALVLANSSVSTIQITIACPALPIQPADEAAYDIALRHLDPA